MKSKVKNAIQLTGYFVFVFCVKNLILFFQYNEQFNSDCVG